MTWEELRYSIDQKLLLTFKHLNYFSQVYIPMENGVDSLNAGVACGVLAFEIRRQLQMIHSQRSVMESVV